MGIATTQRSARMEFPLMIAQTISLSHRETFGGEAWGWQQRKRRTHARPPCDY
jgi:hypothetical protein